MGGHFRKNIFQSYIGKSSWLLEFFSSERGGGGGCVFLENVTKGNGASFRDASLVEEVNYSCTVSLPLIAAR